jgi:hypothetical protein
MLLVACSQTVAVSAVLCLTLACFGDHFDKGRTVCIDQNMCVPATACATAATSHGTTCRAYSWMRAATFVLMYPTMMPWWPTHVHPSQGPSWCSTGEQVGAFSYLDQCKGCEPMAMQTPAGKGCRASSYACEQSRLECSCIVNKHHDSFDLPCCNQHPVPSTCLTPERQFSLRESGRVTLTHCAVCCCLQMALSAT